MADVRLKVDNKIHAGWLKVRLSFSLDSIANSFSLTLTDKWQANAAVRGIKMDAPCEVWIDDTKVMTGYVNDVAPNYDATQHTLEVTGRSKAGDLVDCSHVGKQFINRDLLQMAVELCKPFGIKVTVAAGVDIGPAFKQMEIETGETIYEFLEQAARIRALRFISNIDGDIVITQASKHRLSTPLILGENIKAAAGEFSQRERFSNITVIGSQRGDDNGFAEAAAHVKASHADLQVKRYRPYVINADSDITIAGAKKRAHGEVNSRFGRSKSVVYTVNGWRHATGLWQPNFRVPVQDAYCEMQADLLISEVVLSIDEQGELAQLKVQPPEAFELLPLPEPKSKEVSSGF